MLAAAKESLRAPARPLLERAEFIAQQGLERRHESAHGSRLQRATIRLIDIIGATCILVIAFPALAILALMLQRSSPGKLFFVQRRIGRGGRSFNCFKFRTMHADAAALLQAHLAADPEARAEWNRDFKLRNDPRVTGLGQFARRYSLDEFPQLLNILRGDMSLVGPRPIVVDEIARYGRYFTDYCLVKPGLTGLWQISGRNDVTYRRRIALDCCYARAFSVRINVAILFGTLPAVVKARGSY